MGQREKWELEKEEKKIGFHLSPLPEMGRVWEAMVRGHSMNGAERSHAGPEKGVWTVVVGRAKVLSLGTNLPSRCQEDRTVGYVFRHRQMPQVQLLGHPKEAFPPLQSHSPGKTHVLTGLIMGAGLTGVSTHLPWSEAQMGNPNYYFYCAFKSS